MQRQAGAVVRVFRVEATPDELRAVQPLLAAHVDRFSSQWRQVFAHWVGVAGAGPTIELVTVTGWGSSEDLARASAGAGGRAARAGLMGELVARGRAEDFALVDQLVSSSSPEVASILRLVRLPAVRGAEDELLGLVQPAREGWSETGELSVTQVLRRDDADGPTLLVVAAWRDAASLMRRRGGPGAVVTPARLLRAPASSDTFDLLPVSALRLRPAGPGVLVSDDAGRVVDATPAAASLLGRDVWSLLGERVADFRGSGGSAGAFPVPRPEGGSVLVRARSAPDMPAPGRHATLLVPGSSPAPTEADLREAIHRAYRGWAQTPASHGSPSPDEVASSGQAAGTLTPGMPGGSAP